MYGDGDVEPSKETAVLLCWEACKVGLPLVLAQKLALLDFETRKDAAQVWAPAVHLGDTLRLCMLNMLQPNSEYQQKLFHVCLYSSFMRLPVFKAGPSNR